MGIILEAMNVDKHYRYYARTISETGVREYYIKQLRSKNGAETERWTWLMLIGLLETWDIT